MTKSLRSISAVIITHNVADTIRPCLLALQQICEEVLVVDSFSDDGTVEICRELSVKLISKEWQGYSKTKNLGNQSARHDWILSIDSDEVLSEELILSLQNLELESDKVYALDRLTNFCGKWIYHSGWYPEWKIRLFNRQQVKWQGDYVHETLAIPSHITTEQLKGKLFHFSYKNEKDHLNRIRKYARLSAQERYDQGKKASFAKLWLSPIARFVRTFLLKKGFLDGKAGWIISWRSAYMVRLRYWLLKELWNNAGKFRDKG